MNVLIVGAEGQLGHDLSKEFANANLHRADLDGDGHILDVTDSNATRALVYDLKPDIVLNTAAAHNVATCEKDPATAFSVNAAGARNLATACNAVSARLVHVSTDYVFGDGGTKPFVETDLPQPLSVYAASKLAGEHLIASALEDHIIVRTAAIYGEAACRAKGGRNFIGTMLHLASSRPEVKVVTDEITTPTYTRALAKQMRLLAEEGDPGLYHATCQGACSWYEFAEAIFEETGTDVKLVPTTSSDFQSPVRRPGYSVLENARARTQGLDVMPLWRNALVDYLAATKNKSAY
jgi:dTDP-4-dehydrorhamnose reductase